MNLSKRLFVILSLVLFIILLLLITKIYEKRLIYTKKIEITNKYKPFKEALGFKEKNSKRYVSYYEKHSDLSYQDIVTRVNIGLDYSFYEHVESADITKKEKILVNKYLSLDRNYIPIDLEEINSQYFISGNKAVRKMKKDAKEAFEKLSKASIDNKTPVYGQSAYRSYDKQDILYNEAVLKNGKDIANNDTAKAGFSEHQTGLTIDVSSNKNGNMLDFENTLSYNWMIDNAYKYGFILRYPEGKEMITGYKYESWHYRYVGEKIATDMHDNYPNLTYDEYYFMFVDK